MRFHYDLARQLHKRFFIIGNIQADASLLYSIRLDGYDVTIRAKIEVLNKMSICHVPVHPDFEIKCKAQADPGFEFITLSRSCSRKLAKRVSREIKPSFLDSWFYHP